jgi:hypothetical protein
MKVKLHVLPGDAQTGVFQETGIEGEMIVCREALVDGPVNSAGLEDLWKIRAAYLSGSDDAPDYSKAVVPQFEKLINAPADAEIYLWFEYELFCQVNMWFCLWLLRGSTAAIYRVEPCILTTEDRWRGFGRMDADDLRRCFANRTLFGKADVQLGASLWEAYRSGDNDRLLELSQASSECFPYLEEVCVAAVEKDSKPAQVLAGIAADGITGFGKVFAEFSQRAGVYGFGDVQVKRLFDSSQSS